MSRKKNILQKIEKAVENKDEMDCFIDSLDENNEFLEDYQEFVRQPVENLFKAVSDDTEKKLLISERNVIPERDQKRKYMFFIKKSYLCAAVFLIFFFLFFQSNLIFNKASNKKSEIDAFNNMNGMFADNLNYPDFSLPFIPEIKEFLENRGFYESGILNNYLYEIEILSDEFEMLISDNNFKDKYGVKDKYSAFGIDAVLQEDYYYSSYLYYNYDNYFYHIPGADIFYEDYYNIY